MLNQLKAYCVTVCLLLIGVNCFDEWEATGSDFEIEAPCVFDNDNAGRTCNCGFRNEVKFPIENVSTTLTNRFTIISNRKCIYLKWMVTSFKFEY